MSRNHPDLVSRTTACDHVLDIRAEVFDERATESVSMDDIARRTLAETISATQDVPAWSHATMDGFAFDATDDYPLELVDREVFPEDEPGRLEPGQAVEIATGAPLPAGANAVLKREESTVDAGQLTGPQLSPGTYVYERGSNVEAGETLFTDGEVLSPKDAILLRDLGRETVSVYEQLSVGILATGTEIHEGKHTDLDSPMLAGLIRSWGHDAAYEGTVPDEQSLVQDRIEELAATYDVVVTTGGTSVGHKDHVLSSLSSLGSVAFHRVRIRPGKPIAAARLPDQDAVAFAIPGKPIGAHVISTLVMRPFFTGTTDSLPTTTATLSTGLELGASGFEYVIPVVLEDHDVAVPLGHDSSELTIYGDTFDPSVLSSATRASRADGFIITEDALDQGDTVDVVPYPVVE